MRSKRVASWAGFMHFWGMTHPDQVRALRPYEFQAMYDHAVEASKER